MTSTISPVRGLTKHTPGPWKIGGATEWDAEYGGDADAYSTQPISAGSYQTVCIIVGLNDDDAEFDANARLIAAAPDLLDVAVRVLPILEATQRMLSAEAAKHGMEPDDTLLNAIRAAISKAEQPR